MLLKQVRWTDTYDSLLYNDVCVGSGKTLAYLAPIISQLRKEEAEDGVVPRLRRPRALVLVPSRDLALQVLVSLKMYAQYMYTDSMHCFLLLLRKWQSLCAM